MERRPEIALIAHDLRSAYNVGALFRTADGAGVSRLFLSGHTPGPATKRYLKTRAEKTFSKTALGAEEALPWERVPDVLDLIARLRAEGYRIYALETGEGSIDYRQAPEAKRIALICGNEPEGLPQDVLDACDVVLAIPMRGKKESLNVAVAAGIALYALTGTIRDGS